MVSGWELADVVPSISSTVASSSVWISSFSVRLLRRVWRAVGSWCWSWNKNISKDLLHIQFRSMDMMISTNNRWHQWRHYLCVWHKNFVDEGTALQRILCNGSTCGASPMAGWLAVFSIGLTNKKTPENKFWWDIEYYFSWGLLRYFPLNEIKSEMPKIHKTLQNWYFLQSCLKTEFTSLLFLIVRNVIIFIGIAEGQISPEHQMATSKFSDADTRSFVLRGCLVSANWIGTNICSNHCLTFWCLNN